MTWCTDAVSLCTTGCTRSHKTTTTPRSWHATMHSTEQSAYSCQILLLNASSALMHTTLVLIMFLFIKRSIFRNKKQYLINHQFQLKDDKSYCTVYCIKICKCIKENTDQGKCLTKIKYYKWSRWFDIRPHRRRRRTVQSYSSGGAMCLRMATLASPGEYDRTCASFGPPDSRTQTANRPVQPFFHSSPQCHRALSPNNCPFAWGSGPI